MKPFLFTFFIVLGTIVIVGLGSVLLVLWAYGAGQVVLRILPSGTFTSFEATLLNLVGVLIVGLMVVRFVASSSTNPLSPQTFLDGPDESPIDEMENDEVEADEYPGIPRWRRPTKKIDFSGVQSNDPCPCGSGRKFKNCHGARRAEIKE